VIDRETTEFTYSLPPEGQAASHLGFFLISCLYYGVITLARQEIELGESPKKRIQICMEFPYLPPVRPLSLAPQRARFFLWCCVGLYYIYSYIKLVVALYIGGKGGGLSSAQ
jgi:hypothetical protein